MSFAVIKTGGKQYKVAAGDTIKVEKLEKPAKGSKISFEEVLLVDDGQTTKVGKEVGKVVVNAEIVGEGRHAKVEGVKYKAKSRYRVKYGHRQPYTEVKISEIK